MIMEMLDGYQEGEWTVTLARTNFRPERTFVELERRVPGDDGGVESWCVGFSDTSSEAETLFAAVVRTVEVLLTGDTEDADWMELPEGTFLD